MSAGIIKARVMDPNNYSFVSMQKNRPRPFALTNTIFYQDKLHFSLCTLTVRPTYCFLFHLAKTCVISLLPVYEAGRRFYSSHTDHHQHHHSLFGQCNILLTFRIQQNLKDVKPLHLFLFNFFQVVFFSSFLFFFKSLGA